ncbi:hypothetical protein HGRIS_002799 [Hohenbuehelia grisea]|uniref:Tyrosinase copper-binding domain-containing protein n=1 Tax=Hohenbuehelia grisea TaxID=104357 RepID=A0ABR3JMR6_9AGAR
MQFPTLQALFSVVFSLTTGDYASDTPLPPTSSRCVNPTVRKEWRSLTPNERADWTRAVTCLANLPREEAFQPIPEIAPLRYAPAFNPAGSYYDDIVYLHVKRDEEIHFTGYFLPWHRWYVHSFDTALRSKCSFRGPTPYWNWSMDAFDVYNSPVVQDDNPYTGVGSWGDSTTDYEVPSGPFGASSTFRLSYPCPHVLRRKYELHPYLHSLQPEFLRDPHLAVNTTFTVEKMIYLMNGFDGDYKGFQKFFEDFQGAHSGIHLVIGGDMSSSCPAGAPEGCNGGSKWAPNEPLFWMHHAMVDKIWHDWQRRNPRNAAAFEGGSVQHVENTTIYERYPIGGPPFLKTETVILGDGLFADTPISNLLDTTGGYLCYTYE